ncbi:MAG: beta-galactosidase [Lentisphaeria bacterium]|nr:beta-galactosidase [Lentisphaeria bacterium]
MHRLRFRQVHLDFHTSPAIPGIGAAFDKDEWQEMLRKGHVDSITLFAKCHHGWSYHETSVGALHPCLSFDLLRAQFDACKEMDVNAPIYLSAGVDNVAFEAHPEWHEVDANGQWVGWARSPVQPGFHRLCFHSPYMDYLCDQIRETVRLFPNCDGIFLDIISQAPCCCKWCLEVMSENGLDPNCEEDRATCANMALERYYRMTTEACLCDNPAMPVFHNSGHIKPGQRDILKYFSHLELESLPTGGWGYDHFPMSAKYCKNLDFDFLGMTGKFHTTWGEFGGFKHPNALRYECAAMLAFGSKCSVGDQLHPNGQLDESTYELIGRAYAEVEAKEAWCDKVENVADIGLLSSAAVNAASGREAAGDTGAGRALLEGHFLFDVIDGEMDFGTYRMLILPDDVRVDSNLKQKLDAFLSGGGKLMLTGESGLDEEGAPLFDIGAVFEDESPFRPDFVLLDEAVRPEFCKTPMVMYLPSRRIRPTTGQSLGAVYDPYFNRTDHRHFCSHQHTPFKPEASGYSAGVLNGNILYLAHPVFSIYRGWGAVSMAEYIRNAVNMLLDGPTVEASLPSTARLSLMDQPGESRYVLHLLYANTVSRGGPLSLAGGTVSSRGSIEIIEELMPLRDTAVAVRPAREVARVTLEPQGVDLPFAVEDGEVQFVVEEFVCHQMVVLHYA